MANLFARKPLAKLMAEVAGSWRTQPETLPRAGEPDRARHRRDHRRRSCLCAPLRRLLIARVHRSCSRSFVAGIGCAFAGLCYAEFASMIPVAGSAYTYSYATMGELVAWIIGWDLILEYAVAASTVSIAWSEYCQSRARAGSTCASHINGRIRHSNTTPQRRSRHDERPGGVHLAPAHAAAYSRHKGIGFRQRSHRCLEGEHCACSSSASAGDSSIRPTTRR